MTDVLTRLAASDPLDALETAARRRARRRARVHPRHAPPAGPCAARPPTRPRVLLVGALVVASTATAAAATDVDWDAVLPGGDDGSQPPVHLTEMEREASVVQAAIADPPGLTTPTLDADGAGDVGGGEVGAGASTQLALKQCTWQRALLEAHAAGDVAAETRARAQLARPLFLVPVYGDQAAAVRAVNVDPARLADLQQTWDVNCPGGAYDRTVHPDAPPIGR